MFYVGISYVKSLYCAWGLIEALKNAYKKLSENSFRQKVSIEGTQIGDAELVFSEGIVLK